MSPATPPKMVLTSQKTRCIVSVFAAFPIAFLSLLYFSERHDIAFISSLLFTMIVAFLPIYQWLDKFRASEDSLSDKNATYREKCQSNVSQFVQADCGLIRDKQRLEFVLDVSKEGLWEWNLKTGEVVYNSQCKRILGIEEADDYTFDDFVANIVKEDREKVSCAIKATLEHNKPYDIKFRMRKSDGDIFWVWDRFGIVEFENGEPAWLIGIVQDITESKIAEERLNYLAYYDAQTDLPNSELFKENLSRHLKYDSCENKYSALLFVELDRTKFFVDTYGHAYGEKLLIAVADRLKKGVGNSGEVARFSSDEFVVLLPNLNELSKLATAFAHKLSRQLLSGVEENICLTGSDGIDIKYSVSASVGGIVFDSSEADESDLLRSAHHALFRAKEESLDGLMVFSPEKRIELDRSSQFRKAVHNAFSANEFCTYLQPKYNVKQALIGAEAVLRWHHPEMGILKPNHFLHVAEETNLILPLGNQMLLQACELLSKWQSSQESRHLSISVNVSSKQIWHASFVSSVRTAIEAYKIEPSGLILEISEASLLNEVDEAIDTLAQLKDLGVKLSLDNFGTGYSSLSSLYKLPIDEIKIDCSIIKKIFVDAHALMVVKSITEMASNFGLDVVFEGIETLTQYELLQEYNNSLFQGYYFDMPMPMDKFPY